MGNSVRKQVADLFQFALILCAAVAILVPIYWIASGAFKQQVDVFQLKLLFTIQVTVQKDSHMDLYFTMQIQQVILQYWVILIMQIHRLNQ